MADLFTRSEVTYGGAMHGQSGILTVVNSVAIGVLCQNIQLQYSQQVTRVFELGTTGNLTKAYFVAGRAQGQFTAAHIIGPGVVLGAYYTQFADVCKAALNNLAIDLGPNICTATGVAFAGRLTYKMKNCVLTQIGLSAQAQDMMINENSQLMFVGLEYAGI